ncbi:MAG: sodium:proton antiporter [Ginsengibacter sp.]
MEIYNIITMLVVLAAIFAYINHRLIKLPGSIGIMVLSVVASLIILALGNVFPQIFQKIAEGVATIDFQSIVLRIMLSFLLFAAAIQTDINTLRKERAAIITFATAGVLMSTLITGGLLYFVINSIGISVDLLYCLLFGALISPTDPIAVAGILNKSKIASSLKIRISGESLFNDAMGVILFITFYELAQIGIENFTVWDIALLLIREIAGGSILGAALGYLGYWALRSIDNYVVEVMITLALVMGGYLLAETIGVSGPLSMVIAGLITGNKVMQEVMSDITRDYLDKFWEMIDAVMNAILFLLIGLSMLVVPFNGTLLFIGCMAILIVLFARLASVSIPILLIRKKKVFDRTAIPILTWGALRGGISVALALAVPKYMYGEMFVSITYIVVLFSIVVQGLTIGPFAKRISKTLPDNPEKEPIKNQNQNPV